MIENSTPRKFRNGSIKRTRLGARPGDRRVDDVRRGRPEDSQRRVRFLPLQQCTLLMLCTLVLESCTATSNLRVSLFFQST